MHRTHDQSEPPTSPQGCYQQRGADGFARPPLDGLSAADPKAVSAADDYLQAALQVYQQNRLGILLRTLSATYPHTRTLLGNTLFTQICHAYLKAVAVTSVLTGIGESFPRWLRQQRQADALFADYPFLTALLRFEWGCHQAYHAWQPEAVDLIQCDRWLALSAEQLMAGQTNCERPPPWRLQPALQLVSSRYPIVDICECLQLIADGQDAELMIAPGQRTTWLIWAAPDQTGITTIDRFMLQLLRWLQAPWRCKRSVAQLTAQFALLPQVLQSGWLVANSTDSAANATDSKRDKGAHHAISC
ncbi:DUF2063 domain-containing protein [Corallincola luteus]|uniref:DUF2063 domain-containing protein n=1 Tax=Corallincola luteus TaxID=1775177 RepID=A0ABY2AL29_9GAMM|nr:putative DNA-binding domain-containing protein [Corallincola luteus]TCI03624.1 DUF2063 domain-containing protein [Corallincola luteus]